MIIKRVGPLSCAKIAAIVYAALGLLGGVLLAIFSVLGAAISSTQKTVPISPWIGVLTGAGAVVFLPIFYGAIGFLSALLGAWLYNLVASKVGGIEVDVV
jgi:hypothetical protein